MYQGRAVAASSSCIWCRICRRKKGTGSTPRNTGCPPAACPPAARAQPLPARQPVRPTIGYHTWWACSRTESPPGTDLLGSLLAVVAIQQLRLTLKRAQQQQLAARIACSANGAGRVACRRAGSCRARGSPGVARASPGTIRLRHGP